MNKIKITSVCLFLLLFSFAFFNIAAAQKLSVVPTAADAKESQDIDTYLSSLQNMPQPTYRKPLPNKTIIIYYRVVNTNIQDQIATALRNEKIRRSWNSIELRFMKEEIIITKGNYSKRGKEIELRKIVIN